MKPTRANSFVHVFILSILVARCCAAEPTVTNLFPAIGATNVCTDTPLKIFFNEPVSLGKTGKIQIYHASDNNLADSFNLADAGFTNNFGGKSMRYDAIQVSSNTALIELHSHVLDPGQRYYVRIDPSVFVVSNSNAFPGFTNNFSWSFSTRSGLAKGRTNIGVAADGSGDFCTVQGAVDYVSDDNELPVQIFVRKGVYDGLIYIAPDKSRIHIAGEDRRESIITGRNNDRQNSGRIGRALMSVDATDFTLENITLHNLTPYHGSQAEALRVNGDRCILRNDDFYSFQDTVLLSGSVYVTNCYIEGDVDFIWGQGAVFFDQCEIKAVHNGYYLQARNSADRPGYIFYKCKLTAAPNVTICVLARIDANRFPFSEAEFISCQMGPQIPAIGWEVKGTNTAQLRFGEFHSTDAGGKLVDVANRQSASRQLTETEAAEFSDPSKVLSWHRPWNPREGMTNQ